MSNEQLISELDTLLNKNDRYTFLDYISKNKAIFISAVSIISAVVIFAARVISFLVVRAKYRFWDLDEGFLVEDNHAFLKLGVYVLFFLLLTLLNSFTYRYAYRWELYNCELFLYDRIISHQKKETEKLKNKISQTKKSVDSIENNDFTKEEWLNELLQVEKDNKEIRKNCTASKKLIWKERLSLLVKYLFVMVIVFFASLLLQLASGVNTGDYGTISLVNSSAIITLIIMVTAYLCAFLEIRLTIKGILKRLFKDQKIDWNSVCIRQVIELLESKISEQKKQSLKLYFSDRKIMALLSNILVTTFFMTIYLQFNVNDSLKRMDSFYVFREDQQDYVMLINDGTKYIFSECEINENKLIIDTNKIIVRNDPVDLEKRQFESVERNKLN